MRAFLVAASLAALLAVPALAAQRPAPPSSHNYILGRFADADNRPDDAARYYDAALKADPGDTTLQRRAFDAALAGGDERLAVGLARDLDAARAGDAATALVRLADAVKRRDWAAAAAVKGLPDVGYAAVVAPVTQAWIAVGRGDVDGALALVDPAKFAGVAKSYVTEHRAMILAAARRYADAAPLFVAMVADEAKNVDRLRIAGAGSLAAAHKVDEAKALLAAGDPDPALDAAAKRLAHGEPLAAATEPRQGLAWLMTRLAGDLSREKPVSLALAFARTATFLAPDLGETWLIAGDVLLRGGRAEAALAAFGHVGPRDPVAATAEVHRGLALAELDRNDEARRVFERAATAREATADDWQRLGDFERKLNNHAAAAEDYGKAIALAGDKAGWALYFLRGAAYEQAGDWARAEPDLRRALALQPDDPTVLNYLGYALLDRGQKLAEAQALIATAAKLRPDDGFIADSLGWAWFRSGDFARAVAQLEIAARLEPGDATINDHLGDAYWRVGRRLEARFRWRAAADLSPEPAEAKLLAKKLDFGLDVATADTAPPPPKP
ncbi:MAG: tetratricopeptide repeat protein [Sphingomonadaceae bacterium]|nr:tetratricopeptide repeat protein [Sphingomonadaceae bacterium]